MNISNWLPISYRYGPPLPIGIASYLPLGGIWPWEKGKVRVAPSSGLGDVDGDGFVTQDDITLVEKFILGTVTPTVEQTRRANLRGNGSLDMGIVVIMQNYINGTIDKFPSG